MAVHGLRRKLRWPDFRKVHESPNGFDAQTFTNITVQTRFAFNGQGNWRVKGVNVTLSLNQRETWVVRGREQPELLAHEQRHYDIAAIAARTLEQRLNDLQGDRARSAREMVNQITNDILGERTADGRVISRGVLQEVQDRYDDDVTCGSDHSRNRDNQALWTLNISRVMADDAAGIEELNSCPRPRQTPKPRASNAKFAGRQMAR